ncbi:MAG: DeoR family transcriptional regulator, aga operon transcriptional repressor [Gaiellaceae bacterium]|nr:DeoR family transcriptional regulator, aga operon transcriptional repressor [Gaiellaceae bacterium]
MPASAPDPAGDIPAGLRRERMLTLIQQSDYMRVTDLGARFGISDVTVRSDLDALAARDEIQRIRGGAIPRNRPGEERPFEETQGAFAAEKVAIGHTAAAQVRSGEAILLDVGTTAAAVARALVARTELQDVVVFTNGLTTALELEPAIPRITVVVLGGTLRPLQHSLVDPLATLVLAQIKVSTVFLGCNGVDPVAGVTNVNLPEAEMKKAMLQVARRTVVLADGSKLGRVELAHLCDVGKIDALVTGESAESDVVAALEEHCAVQVCR